MSGVKNTYYAQLSCVDDSEPSTFLRERDRQNYKVSAVSSMEGVL